MTQYTFDLVVIGGGPGGYVTAIRASQLGMKVGLVERAHLGGICLNWGCIPTKALLRSAEVYETMHRAKEFGLKAEKISFDLQEIVKRSRGVASQLSGGIKHLMKKNKVVVIEGHAKLKGAGKLEITDGAAKGDTISAKHIVIATGARARVLPGLEPDGKLIWTYKEAMTPDKMPKKLLVVGSGAIGIEFASFYQTFGAEVTVVEIQDQVLPVEDAEIAAIARKAFEKQGMKIITGASVKGFKPKKDSVVATIDKGGKTEEQEFDRVIMAVGITGNTEELGLETTKVKVDRGHIVTDGYGQTAEKGVYAIGDVAGAPWLAHKASHEGIICVEKIAGEKDVHPLKKELIPGCTYCRPQVASVGLTEAKAKDAGYEMRVGRFPIIGNGKAIAMGEADHGLIKVIFDKKTGEMLGAHMVGAEVTELIQGYAVGMQLETTELDLMHTVFPHPTLSEMMHEAVLDAYGKVIHM